MAWSAVRPTRADWRTLLPVSVAMVLLFVGSFYPFVTIIVQVRHIGDVSVLMSRLWRITTGLASLFSLLLAVYEYRSDDGTDDDGDERESAGPDTVIEIHGNEGEIHLPLAVEEEPRIERSRSGAESTAPPDDEETDADSGPVVEESERNE